MAHNEADAHLDEFSALVSSALDLETDHFVVISSDSGMLAFSSTRSEPFLAPGSPTTTPTGTRPPRSHPPATNQLSSLSTPDLQHAPDASSSQQPFLKRVKKLASIRPLTKSRSPSSMSLCTAAATAEPIPPVPSVYFALSGSDGSEPEHGRMSTPQPAWTVESTDSFFAHHYHYERRGSNTSTVSSNSNTTECSLSTETEPASVELVTPSSSYFPLVNENEKDAGMVESSDMLLEGRLGPEVDGYEHGLGRVSVLGNTSRQGSVPAPKPVRPSTPKKSKSHIFSYAPFSSSSLPSPPTLEASLPEFDLDVFAKGPPKIVHGTSNAGFWTPPVSPLSTSTPSKGKGEGCSRSQSEADSAAQAPISEPSTTISRTSRKQKRSSLPVTSTSPFPSPQHGQTETSVWLSTSSRKDLHTRLRLAPRLTPSPSEPLPVLPVAAGGRSREDGETVPPVPVLLHQRGKDVAEDGYGLELGFPYPTPLPITAPSPSPTATNFPISPRSKYFLSSSPRRSHTNTLSVISSDDDGEHSLALSTTAKAKMKAKAGLGIGRPSSPFPLPLGPRGNKNGSGRLDMRSSGFPPDPACSTALTPPTPSSKPRSSYDTPRSPSLSQKSQKTSRSLPSSPTSASTRSTRGNGRPSLERGAGMWSSHCVGGLF